MKRTARVNKWSLSEMIMAELDKDKILSLLQPYFEKREDIIQIFEKYTWHDYQFDRDRRR